MFVATANITRKFREDHNSGTITLPGIYKRYSPGGAIAYYFSVMCRL